MKKIILLILLFSITITSCNLNNSKIYYKEPRNKREKSYYKGLRKVVDKRKLQTRCPKNPN